MRQEPRHLAALPIDPAYMFDVLTGAVPLPTLDIPADARVVGGYYDDNKRIFLIVLEHPWFHTAAPGTMLPWVVSPLGAL